MIPIDQITLRDYFAAKIMQALVTRSPSSLQSLKVLAEYAYGLADVMLVEREGQ